MIGVSLLQSEHDSLEEKINSISSSLDIDESKVYEIAQGNNIYNIIDIINNNTIKKE
jgi:hypothetical protein